MRYRFIAAQKAEYPVTLMSRILKVEFVHETLFHTRAQATREIFEYIEGYCQVVRRVPQVGGRRCSGGHFGGVGVPQTEGISSGMAV